MFLLVYSGDHNHMHIFISLETSVLEPDLEMGGGQSSRLLGKGVQSPEKIFQFGLRIGRGAGPPGPSHGLGSATKPSCLIGNDLRLTQFHSRGDKYNFQW